MKAVIHYGRDGEQAQRGDRAGYVIKDYLGASAKCDEKRIGLWRKSPRLAARFEFLPVTMRMPPKP